MDIQNVMKYVQACTSPYHTVDTSLQMLVDAGFQELSLEEDWSLTSGDYVVNVFGSSLFAFHIGDNPRSTLRIASAHTDFPALRVKPNPVIGAAGYTELNVEVYGGLIENTWLDRPLAAAGTVVLRGDDAFHVESVLLDTKRPIGIVPNLAIHMNRDINDGVKLDRQKHLLPIIMLDKGEESITWEKILSEEIGCREDEILSYEITLYPVVAPMLVGVNEDMLSSPRLDNITSCYACLQGMLEARQMGCPGIRMAMLFDNEEVGSRTKQGGAGMILPNLVERVYRGLGFTHTDLDVDRSKGFMISIDVAHGMHPNHPDKNDITNVPVLGQGIALKMAASQSYAGDAKAVAIVKSLCDEANVDYQIYVNRSNIPGGSTVGSISSAMFPMRTMDIGIPLLAMHSAVELMGVNDQTHLNRLMIHFLGAL